ncbi:MAG TPA: antitoxin Xre/MbcA/ParS toxin-binding domain-containing protein [Sediminibacterium sp.]|nr:antitoxin Xre/MbcA/ParS toxin-binding domain-containing protein [Sediminibacterium sp.]
MSKPVKIKPLKTKPGGTPRKGSVLSIVREPVLGYVANTVVKVPGEMTGFEKMVVLEGGLSKNDLVQLKDKSGLGYDQLADVLSAARTTLINKKGTERFSRDLSERILSLADIYSYGYKVFEAVDAFNEWVDTPNAALGGKKPFDLLNNQFGREEIKNLIGRIEYGVYS